MNIGITAIGTATPAFKGSQQQVVDFMSEALQLSASQQRRLKILYENTGIAYRYSVLRDFQKSIGEFEFFPNDRANPFPSTAQRMKIYQQQALPLALAAIKNCLTSNKKFSQKDITHLVVVSCTGMYAPGIDIEIIEKLNLSSTVQRTAINFMGCYGAFNGIKVAHAICRGNPEANVLVVCVELCTLHFQKSKTMDDLIASAIFADGAGAVLIQGKSTASRHFSLENFYCDILPQSNQEMTWHIGDQGFNMNLSAYVPSCIESGIEQFAKKMLLQKKITIAEIDHFAIHPGGLKILQACEKALKITAEQNQHSYQVLHDYGNMSSCTVLFVLQKIWQGLRAANHRDIIFSCAFGPGLTLESMLLKINYA